MEILTGTAVSLGGPVPISSLPDATTEPPRQGSRELLLDSGINGVESNWKSEEQPIKVDVLVPPAVVKAKPTVSAPQEIA